MIASLIKKIRTALPGFKKVTVAIPGAGDTGQGLELRIGAQAECGHLNRRPSGLSPRSAYLTGREVQILELIAEGMHNRQIAARIRRSVKTVEKHRTNLNFKLGTHEVTGLTRYALSAGLVSKPLQLSHGLETPAKHLTTRELQILKFVAQGSCNKWIASELHRSIKTVDHHRENIMKKLGIHTVAGLTRYAVFLGLM